MIMSEIPTIQAVIIPMADTTISTTPESSITEHPISESCKKAKIADTTTTITGELISGLPDAVLCHILSYVPTRDAVATGVLSKRWNRLWTSVPNLDFSGQFRSISGYPVNKASFMNFVDNVLSLNSVSCVRKIYLSFYDDCDASRVNSWISAIVSRDAEEFHLGLPRWCRIENLDQSSRIYSLPSTFFARKNLVNLWLGDIVLQVATSVYFPNLKTITFQYVQFLDDDTMKNILSGCPALWRLSINRGGAWDNAHTLYVCSSTLRSLHLDTDYCDNKNSGYKVVIEAPNVSFLSLSDIVDADYDINNLSSLVEANISVEQDGGVCPDVDVFNNRLIELFRKISHVEKLCLEAATMRSLEYASLENLPMFNNLTCLKVELDDNSWAILPYLFHCTPNLVTFVVHKLHDNVHPDCCWYEPNDVPKCFLSCLENIEVGSFEDCDADKEMVYYFLKNAVVLKKLSIDIFNLDLETDINILKLLSAFPRSSSTCRVEYI